jgi:hypothetical protein
LWELQRLCRSAHLVSPLTASALSDAMEDASRDEGKERAAA